MPDVAKKYSITEPELHGLAKNVVSFKQKQDFVQ